MLQWKKGEQEEAGDNIANLMREVTWGKKNPQV